MNSLRHGDTFIYALIDPITLEVRYKHSCRSEETKRKIGLANSISLKGKKFSELHKLHLSEAHKRG